MIINLSRNFVNSPPLTHICLLCDVIIETKTYLESTDDYWEKLWKLDFFVCKIKFESILNLGVEFSVSSIQTRLKFIAIFFDKTQQKLQWANDIPAMASLILNYFCPSLSELIQKMLKAFGNLQHENLSLSSILAFEVRLFDYPELSISQFSTNLKKG